MFTEFFCGIGGLACCWPKGPSAWSIDINERALQIHALNFGHRHWCQTIESITARELQAAPRDFWWMSPPCQPYTKRGKRHDADDPRARALHHLLGLIREITPTSLALENVPGFADSRSHQQVLTVLESQGYSIRERLLCPTELGSRNRRRRYYLLASQRTLPDWRETAPFRDSRFGKTGLESSLDGEDFRLPHQWLLKYGKAIRIVGETDFLHGTATTSCFTSAYGRSPVRSGSYLRGESGIRFFTPREVLWQLGFPRSFVLPNWAPQKLWPLVGNSLSLPAIKYLLDHLPGRTVTSPVQHPTPL